MSDEVKTKDTDKKEEKQKKSETAKESKKSGSKLNLSGLLIIPVACLAAFLTFMLFPQNISVKEDAQKSTSNHLELSQLENDARLPGETEGEEASEVVLNVTESTEEAAETVGDPLSAEGDDSWMLTLVNKDHPLPADYEITLTTLSNGQTVDSRIYPSLQEMFNDMRAQGYYPMVRSGYRSYQDQEKLVNNRIREYMNDGMSEEEAKEKTYSEAALPGTSEHQLGLGVDINPDRQIQNNDKVYTWLAEHAHEYGFIKRFPEEKTDITGIVNEPWHYRYVGTEAAAAMHESGECLEEYLAK